MGRPWFRKTLLGAAALVYLLISLNVLFALWMHTGFCDPSEENCALAWTWRRIALWVGWSLLGLAVVMSAAVALRPRSGPLADRRLAAAGGAALVLAGLAVALSTKASGYGE